jgi:hypothetical protein
MSDEGVRCAVLCCVRMSLAVTHGCVRFVLPHSALTTRSDTRPVPPSSFPKVAPYLARSSCVTRSDVASGMVTVGYGRPDRHPCWCR